MAEHKEISEILISERCIGWGHACTYRIDLKAKTFSKRKDDPYSSFLEPDSSFLRDWKRKKDGISEKKEHIANEECITEKIPSFELIKNLDDEEITTFLNESVTHGFLSWKPRYVNTNFICDETTWGIDIKFSDSTSQFSSGVVGSDNLPETWVAMADAFEDLTGTLVLKYFKWQKVEKRYFYNLKRNIELWDGSIPYFNQDLQIGLNENAPTLTTYLITDGTPKPCIIIFPGGGYRNRADHEGEPVAKWLNTLGYHAFVLNYRIAPYQYPAPFADAMRAIRHVRYHADEYEIIPDKIGVLGFSAGGHLACMASTLYDDEFYPPADAIDTVSARPDAAVLCYPVVSFVDYAHEGSLGFLLGENPTSELKHKCSGELAVHAQMPPVFLWHTVEDASVPVENALNLAAALRKNHVPFALHIFNKGVHGLGIKGIAPQAAKWTDLCAGWLKETLAE